MYSSITNHWNNNTSIYHRNYDPNSNGYLSFNDRENYVGEK